MKKIKRDIVSAIIFSKDQKLLIGRKNPKSGGVYIDCWHIPGGGVGEKETKNQTLRREVFEEVGIDINPYKVSLVDDKGQGSAEKIINSGEKVICKMKFFVYRVDINDKNADEIVLNLNDDLMETRWVTLNKLSSFKLTPPSVELFTKLGYLKKGRTIGRVSNPESRHSEAKV